MVAAVLTETTTEVETVQAETTIVAETDQAETTMEVETMAAVPMVISMVVEAGQATTQEAVQATFALVSPALTAPDVWQLQDVADKQLDTILIKRCAPTWSTSFFISSTGSNVLSLHSNLYYESHKNLLSTDHFNYFPR